jgi:hypothetical protein
MVSGFRLRAKFQGKREVRRVGMADFRNGNVKDSNHAPQPGQFKKDAGCRPAFPADYNKPPPKMCGKSRMGIG